MIDNPAKPGDRGCGGGLGSLLLEALAVAVAGAAFAFLANQFSPRGLNLARNYFPGGGPPAAPAAAHAPPPAPSLAARLQEKGLHLIERDQAEQLFRDPRFLQNAILFIDARDEDHYREGHIPGAREFFPYYPEKYLADVLPFCQIAEQIVVYCAGGDCEDSESAALMLRDAGIPGEKLFVFGGGMPAWMAAGLPVESGARNSGNIHNPAP
jgi:rhodanese-related sulfurtransferase